jgi:hypothetical protein
LLEHALDHGLEEVVFDLRGDLGRLLEPRAQHGQESRKELNQVLTLVDFVGDGRAHAVGFAQAIDELLLRTAHRVQHRGRGGDR